MFLWKVLQEIAEKMASKLIGGRQGKQKSASRIANDFNDCDFLRSLPQLDQFL